MRASEMHTVDTIMNYWMYSRRSRSLDLFNPWEVASKYGLSKVVLQMTIRTCHRLLTDCQSILRDVSLSPRPEGLAGT